MFRAWARRKNLERGLDVHHEVSIMGGMTKTTETMTLEEARARYAEIRAATPIAKASFDRRVSNILTAEFKLPHPSDATPAEWVKAARYVQVRATHRGPEWN